VYHYGRSQEYKREDIGSGFMKAMKRNNFTAPSAQLLYWQEKEFQGLL